MTYNAGKLCSILKLAVMLSWFAVWVIAHRYRRVMWLLMKAPDAGESRADAPVERFVWRDARQIDARKRREVLALVLEGGVVADRLHNMSLKPNG